MNKILKFDLSADQVQLKKILNQDFAHLRIDAISDVFPNLNDSAFTKESLEEGKATCYSKPILGFFKEGVVNGADFKGHEGSLRIDKELLDIYWDNQEIPMGVIRDTDTVEVVQKGGLSWLRIDCVLWTKYNYKAVKSILKSKKKRVSVEIEVLDSEKADFEGKKIEMIRRFNLLGITILGDKYQEAIPGANLTVVDFVEDKLYAKKIACLQFAYKELNEQTETKMKTSIKSSLLQEDDEDLEEDLEEEVESEDNLSAGIQDSEIPLEEGGQTLLTMNQRREILEVWLRDHMEDLPGTIGEEEEDCHWVWVADIDDTYVYFEHDGTTYKAPYIITETDEGRDIIVNLEEAVRVIRSWEDFTADSETEAPSTTATFEAEVGEGSTAAVFSAEDYVERTTFEELQTQYNEAMEELNRYHEAEAEARRNALKDFGYGLVDAESMLDSTDTDVINGIKAGIAENCGNNTFSTEVEVKTFTEDALAKAVYQKLKKAPPKAKPADSPSETSPEQFTTGEEFPEGNQSEGNEAKEFTAPIIEQPSTKSKANSFDSLKEFVGRD